MVQFFKIYRRIYALIHSLVASFCSCSCSRLWIKSFLWVQFLESLGIEGVTCSRAACPLGSRRCSRFVDPLSLFFSHQTSLFCPLSSHLSHGFCFLSTGLLREWVFNPQTTPKRVPHSLSDKTSISECVFSPFCDYKYKKSHMELLKAITALSLVRKVDFTGLPGHARPRDAKGFVRLSACKEDTKTLRALSPQEKGKLPVIIMLADFTGLPGRARPLPTKGFVRQSAQSSHPKKLCIHFALIRKAMYQC